jgi:hydroxyacylglutathione hydrolase
LLRVETITSGKWRENCYIVHDESGVAIAVDPGEGAEEIVAAIETKRLELKAIVNTHAHYDHVGGVSLLKESFNAPFHIHAADRRLLAQANFYRSIFGGERIIPIPEIDVDLATSGTLEFGAMRIEIIASPGHTPGGVTLRIGEMLFSGDNLLGKRIGSTDLPGGDKAALRESIRTLFRLPRAMLVYPGHGRPRSLAELAAVNPAVAEILT